MFTGFQGGQVGTGDSFYAFNTTADTGHTVAPSGLTADVDLHVFADSGFTQELCASTKAGAAEESCKATPTGHVLYIEADSKGAGTFLR